MKLSAPKQSTWTVALLLGILAILSRYSGMGISIVSGLEFLLLTVAFVVLLLGTILKNF